MKAKTPATGGLAAVVVLAGWLGFDVAADWAAKALGVERVECDAMFDPTCSLRSLWAWGKGAWSNLAGRSPERDPHVGTHLLDLSPEDQDRRIALIGEGEIAHLVGKGIPEEDLLSRTGDAVYWQMLLLPAPSEQARREMARIVLVATRIAIAPEEGPGEDSADNPGHPPSHVRGPRPRVPRAYPLPRISRA